MTGKGVYHEAQLRYDPTLVKISSQGMTVQRQLPLINRTVLDLAKVVPTCWRDLQARVPHGLLSFGRQARRERDLPFQTNHFSVRDDKRTYFLQGSLHSSCIAVR